MLLQRASMIHLPSLVLSTRSPIIGVLTAPPRCLFSDSPSHYSFSLMPTRCSIHFPTSRVKLDLFMRKNRRALLPSAAAAYGSNSNSESGREILVQHLVVKEEDQKILLELQKRASEGEDLGDLAVEYSICPSKEEGGMLGWVRKGQMVQEFEEAAFNAPLNEVVRCRTKFGWHLLQVLSERDNILGQIQPSELHEKMQDPLFLDNAQLIDVREPDEVAKASLPGFNVFPLRQFGNWGPGITTELDPHKDTYVMCHHGMRSLQVAQWLQTQGFKRVFNVSGGIHEYAVKVDRSIPTY